ncbi:hypothetical protein ACA910_003779 [Epithemia clementina (nom. ined.)]
MDRVGLTIDDWLSEMCLVSAVTSDPDEPKDFQEAWHHPDLEARAKWRAAIKKELRCMREKGVWRKIDRRNVPPNRRLIGNKWVFKIKRDGVYRARLVALGYSQIPGVDYFDNFAPVVNDVTFRMIITRMMIEKWESMIIDVETAFLYGILEEEIYMKMPQGYWEVEGQQIDVEACCQLLKSAYGLVQAARQWWKRCIKQLKEWGFQVSKADPCLLYRKDENGICIVIMYVDDILVVGNKNALEDLKNSFEKVFTVKIDPDLKDYLGCELVVDERKQKAWMGQPSIMKKLGKQVQKVCIESEIGENSWNTRLLYSQDKG